MLVFDRFDAAASGFPPPAVPLLPTLRWRDLSLAGDAVTRRALDEARHFSRGRYALHAAFQLAGVGPGTSVLAPSYHCRTMIDPALALGADAVFYPVDAGLAPSIETIVAVIESAAASVRALVLPHYFGMAQNARLVDGLATECAARAIVLIEDCSHSWELAAAAVTRPGAVSRWRMVMASPYKFFATPDGGSLWCEGSPRLAPNAGGRPAAELKALLRILRPRTHRPAPVAATVGAPGADHAETSPVVSIHYLPAEQGEGGLSLSRWIMRHTLVEAAALRRRRNFQALAAATAPLPSARALYTVLPDDCAPYMFPLHINEPAAPFDLLKRMGVPIWRWDDMARSTCKVARDYRLGLLHLPCHQDIDAGQMAWICTQLATVLGSGTPRKQ